VEPGEPIWPTPIASMISATESPVEVVGASEMSTMPNGTPIRPAISRPISSPARVILKTVRLITSESWVRSQSGFLATTLRTTPGPEMPMFRE